MNRIFLFPWTNPWISGVMYAALNTLFILKQLLCHFQVNLQLILSFCATSWGNKPHGRLCLILTARMDVWIWSEWSYRTSGHSSSHADRMARALREPQTAATNSLPCHAPNILPAEREKAILADHQMSTDTRCEHTSMDLSHMCIACFVSISGLKQHRLVCAFLNWSTWWSCSPASEIQLCNLITHACPINFLSWSSKSSLLLRLSGSSTSHTPSFRFHWADEEKLMIAH